MWAESKESPSEFGRTTDWVERNTSKSALETFSTEMKVFFFFFFAVN